MNIFISYIAKHVVDIQQQLIKQDSKRCKWVSKKTSYDLNQNRRLMQLLPKHSNIKVYLDLQTGNYKTLSGKTCQLHTVQLWAPCEKWWGWPQCETLPPALWNHTGDLKLTQSLWPLWPGCYITTGGSWPLCGLLCASLGSAGCSWSSDLCCWTRLAPSGHHTPPERRMERKYDSEDSNKGDRKR